jgi:RNA polymerase sigma factor (sigma-70 family)
MQTLRVVHDVFSDLVDTKIAERHVIAQLGYEGLDLSDGTKSFLVQAWMGHLLDRGDEQRHAKLVATERGLVGLPPDGWSDAALASHQALVVDNLWLVARIARRYVGQGLDVDDLIQEGTIGLLRAIDNFDPDREARLPTYASYWIRQVIQRSIEAKSLLIHLPHHVQEEGREVESMAARYWAEFGRWPTSKRIAELCHISEVAAHACLVTAYPFSFDHPQLRGFFASCPSGSETSPETAFEQSELQELITSTLSCLSARESAVVEHRLGIVDGRSWTLDEIGRKFGATSDLVQRLESKALKRLRHPSRSKQLRPFLDHEEDKLSLSYRNNHSFPALDELPNEEWWGSVDLLQTEESQTISSIADAEAQTLVSSHRWHSRQRGRPTSSPTQPGSSKDDETRFLDADPPPIGARSDIYPDLQERSPSGGNRRTARGATSTSGAARSHRQEGQTRTTSDLIIGHAKRQDGRQTTLLKNSGPAEPSEGRGLNTPSSPAGHATKAGVEAIVDPLRRAILEARLGLNGRQQLSREEAMSSFGVLAATVRLAEQELLLMLRDPCDRAEVEQLLAS